MLFLIVVSLYLGIELESIWTEIKIKIISKDTWLRKKFLMPENNLKVPWIKYIAERLRNCSVSCMDTQYLGYSAHKHELSNQHKRHAIATSL